MAILRSAGELEHDRSSNMVLPRTQRSKSSLHGLGCNVEASKRRPASEPTPEIAANGHLGEVRLDYDSTTSSAATGSEGLLEDAF